MASGSNHIFFYVYWENTYAVLEIMRVLAVIKKYHFFCTLAITGCQQRQFYFIFNFKWI